MENEKKEFKGLKKHTVCTLPLLKDQRKESLEYTLTSSSDFSSSFPRTTHLYKSDKTTLEAICEKVGGSFMSANILHESSDLGLVYKIVIEHENGYVFAFDGLYLRITQVLSDDYFNLLDLLPLACEPAIEYNIIDSFVNQFVKPLYSKAIQYSIPNSYYTIDEVDFEKIGLTRINNAQAVLILNYPNYFTISPSNSVKQGKKFRVYIGDEDRINQMIAHDFFMDYEIELFSNFFREQLNCVLGYQKELKNCFDGAFEPIWKINIKKKKWDRMKEILISLYKVMELIEKGQLCSEAIHKIVENKIAFFNIPRQIWSHGEEMDEEEKIPYSTNHFFVIEVENNELKQSSKSPVKPSYFYRVESLQHQLIKLKNITTDLYNKEKDLVSMYQTEFALDSVKIASVALMVSFTAILLTLLLSIDDLRSLISGFSSFFSNSTIS